MNDFQNPPTIEDGVKTMISSAKDSLNEQLANCRSCVREKPGRSILLAVGAGYLLHRLPVRSLLVTQVKLLAALAPPTMLAFGAAKLGEFLQGQCQKSTAEEIPRGSGVEAPGFYQEY